MVDRTDSPDLIDPVPDPDALAALTHLYNGRRWGEVVDFTDAWLDARGTLPALAAHYRAAGLQGVGEYGEALTWAALACNAYTKTTFPDDRTAWVSSRVGLAQALTRLGRYDEALHVFRAVLKVPTHDPDARTALGHLRLCLRFDRPAQFRRGWADHEARIGTQRAPTIPGVPAWDGKPTTGPVVVLHEQGLGDAVLFARWLPWVAEVSGHPVIWAGPKTLHRWIAGLPGVGQCLDVTDALLVPTGDTVTLAHGVALVRAMSLPHVHGTQPDTIPEPAWPMYPSAEASPIRTTRSLTPAERVGYGQRVRVGVCWAGASGGHHDFERTIDPATFAHLWTTPIPHVEYVSLQYATPAPDGAPFGHGPEGDVYATAERIASCDLVVSVDTSVIHLAGSLHVPTICLVPTTPDWRYPNWPHGHDTPWYPSVIVVRRDRADATEDQVRTARALAEDMVTALLAPLDTRQNLP